MDNTSKVSDCQEYYKKIFKIAIGYVQKKFRGGSKKNFEIAVRGFQKKFENLLGNMGSNKLLLYPGISQYGKRFYNTSVVFLQQIPDPTTDPGACQVLLFYHRERIHKVA
jgi:hypothetical protein